MYKLPRGTFDIIGDDNIKRDSILDAFFTIANLYNFEKINTPIFEDANLFLRAVGEETDIVSKEMFIFNDRKDRLMALRPELTAPIVRSYIENKFYAQNPEKRFVYYGPAFRYERPQAGRYRQFHQFGVETFGIKNPCFDAEIISMAVNMLDRVYLWDDATLLINSLGNENDRKNYISALQEYFNAHKSKMCDDCKTRLESNPLRVLDCKVDSKLEFFKNAPKIYDYLSEESKKYFDEVKAVLDKLGISYIVDSNLVRGLDYYNDVVFEIVIDNNNANNTLVGGGRYDGLSSQLDGPSIPTFGFAMGIERILNEIKDFDIDFDSLDVFISYDDDKYKNDSMKLLYDLRSNGLKCDITYEVKTRNNIFKKIKKLDVLYWIEVIDENRVRIRNLKTNEDREVQIVDMIKEFMGE